MIDLRRLSKEDRVNMLVQNVKLNHVTTNQLGFLGQADEIISDDILVDLFEKIESRIYYITEEPRFEIVENGYATSYSVGTMDISIDDLVNLINITHIKRYIIFYNIKSVRSKYHFRCYFVDDIGDITRIDREDELHIS